MQLSEPEQEFWSDVHPEFITMHELRSDLPCECVHFVQPEFRSWHWAMMHNLGDVESRNDALAMTAVYDFHEGFLQTMQYLDGEPQTFLLKVTCSPWFSRGAIGAVPRRQNDPHSPRPR